MLVVWGDNNAEGVLITHLGRPSYVPSSGDPMAETASNPSGDQVVVAYAVEISIPVTAEAGDTDFASYGGEIVRDAIAGWGVAVKRIVHLADPDSIFPAAKT